MQHAYSVKSNLKPCMSRGSFDAFLLGSASVGFSTADKRQNFAMPFGAVHLRGVHLEDHQSGWIVWLVRLSYQLP
jgi:hypothetical protein